MKRDQFLKELEKKFKQSIELEGNVIMQTERAGFDGVWKYQVKLKMPWCNGADQDTIVFWVENLNWDNEKILEVRWEGWHPEIDAKLRSILKGHDIHCESESERFNHGPAGYRKG